MAEIRWDTKLVMIHKLRKRASDFVSNPLATLEGFVYQLEEIKERILTMDGYEWGKSTTFVGSNVGLNSIDPASNITAALGAGMVVKVNKYVNISLNSYILKNISSISKKVGDGHAWTKHSDEFIKIGIISKGELSDYISLTIKNVQGTKYSKQLDRGRVAFWDNEKKVVIIYNPKDSDIGTAYVPETGIDDFNNLQ